MDVGSGEHAEIMLVGDSGPFHMDTVNQFSAFTGATYPVLKPVYIALTRFQTWIENPLRSRI